MKKRLFSIGTVLLATLISTVITPAQTPAPAIAKTSYAEVTSQLDPGGNFYLYLGTAQWLDHLSTKFEGWRGLALSLPDLKAEDKANVEKGFDVAKRIIRDSGVEEITGLGLSSVEIEPGLYRNKALLHHYPGHDQGFLWKLGGQKPHPLTGLDLLPTTTTLALFADLDLPLLWQVIQDETAKSGFPDATNFLNQVPAEFEKNTKVNWDQFLHSLGGEFGLVMTLNPSNNVPIPVPPTAISIPEPGLMLVVRVNDDTIFNRIAEELKSNPQVISQETNGLRLRIMPMPIPFLPYLQPAAASSGGYLLIASSDALVKEALAVKAGEKPGLKSTAEFKRLAQNLPTEGNQFAFVGERFSQTMQQIQAQSMNNAGSPEVSAWFKSLMDQMHSSAACFSVGVNAPNGCLTIGNGSQSYANLAVMPIAIVPGMLAAIAVPNFVKARATAQQNACINNLRQLDAAKAQWALEKSKKEGDEPTKEDLLPYLKSWPTCPQGGEYHIGKIGEKTTCSIPGHTLGED
jgi:hypothetical protein